MADSKTADQILIDILDIADADTSLILYYLESSDIVVIKKSELPEVTIERKPNEPTECKVMVNGVLEFDGVDKSVLLRR